MNLIFVLQIARVPLYLFRKHRDFYISISDSLTCNQHGEDPNDQRPTTVITIIMYCTVCSRCLVSPCPNEYLDYSTIVRTVHVDVTVHTTVCLHR